MTTEVRTPNERLRAVRLSLRMSQDDLARALRESGQKTGKPNDASKRLVQRWESGVSTRPRPVYARALESVTGLPIDALGFELDVPAARVADDGHGGHDLESAENGVAAAHSNLSAQPDTGKRNGNYSGIWLSRYEYFSSGRENTFTGLHYVILLQHGNRLTVRSLPGSSDSPLTMSLELDGNVVTGNWTEQTASTSYYAGARYHGAIQMLVDPSGRRMLGKWVGFGKEFDVNTGPWALEFKEGSTSKAAMDKWNHKPE